jgi:hypothetical protein
MSSGGWGWARPVVPGCASLLACLVLTPSNVVMKAAITTTASATAKIATAVRRLFRSLFMPSLLRQRWMAGVVPLVVWLHTLPHNILTDPAECHAWLSAPWDEASKLQRPLPDGVLKIVASGEPMDGDAGVSTPLRSPSASATRTILIGRNGAAASIRDRVGGEHQSDTAATFDEARADFEHAWQAFLSKRTEADFQAWRDQRDWTARKYALWDAGKRLEPPSHGPGKPCSRFRWCPAARYSTCTAPRRCWCMCLTSRRPSTPKKKAVESAQQLEA